MKRIALATIFFAIPFTALIKTASAQSLAATSETGEINGAQFKIEIPANWNHGLVIYCHGYDEKAAPGEGPGIQTYYDIFLKEGYAVARSGYSAGGWAVEQAVADTEALREYFTKKYGAPKETYVTGHSMGGFLTMELLEKFPQAYDAGLALCGPLGAASWFMERKPFDDRVVFDYYFPGLLPSPAKVPQDYQQTPELGKKLFLALESQQPQAETLRRYMGIHTNKDLAGWMVFATYILKDLQQRSGGNAFDNRNTIYVNTGDDNTVNDGVQRYAADPGAPNYVRKYYTPTGDLQRPMLAIHTTYDPIVPPWVPDSYGLLVRETGHADHFVQQYVKHDGHCAISPEESARGFGQLRAWKAGGAPPPSGWNH